MKTVLYVGTRKGLDEYMFNHDINPSEHGNSVKWARNGPNHLRLSDAPVEVVVEDWYEKTIWDETAISTARHLNAIEKNQRRRKTKA